MMRSLSIEFQLQVDIQLVPPMTGLFSGDAKTGNRCQGTTSIFRVRQTPKLLGLERDDHKIITKVTSFKDVIVDGFAVLDVEACKSLRF